MPTESVTNELVSLTRDAREHLTYLHELGIEGVETQVDLSVIQDVRSQTSWGSSQTLTQPFGDLAPALGDTLFGEIKPQPSRLTKSSETFEEIHAYIGNCVRCPLFEGRTHIVHTEGNRNARLMFIGEAPGADEDAQAQALCRPRWAAFDEDH